MIYADYINFTGSEHMESNHSPRDILRIGDLLDHITPDTRPLKKEGVASEPFVVEGDREHVYIVVGKNEESIIQTTTRILEILPENHLMDLVEALSKGQIKSQPSKVHLDADCANGHYGLNDFKRSYFSATGNDNPSRSEHHVGPNGIYVNPGA